MILYGTFYPLPVISSSYYSYPVNSSSYYSYIITSILHYLYISLSCYLLIIPFFPYSATLSINIITSVNKCKINAVQGVLNAPCCIISFWLTSNKTMTIKTLCVSYIMSSPLFIIPLSVTSSSYY